MARLRDMLQRAEAPANDIHEGQRPSLDNLAASVRSAQNYVVTCEAELEMAKMRLIEAQERFAEEVNAQRLGVVIEPEARSQ